MGQRKRRRLAAALVCAVLWVVSASAAGWDEDVIWEDDLDSSVVWEDEVIESTTDASAGGVFTPSYSSPYTDETERLYGRC